MGDSSGDGAEDGRALYRLPPEEFTAARDALVRRLRSAGERAKAEEVRRLRRPNAPAWALDQVAQDRPELIDGVLVAGAELREAMESGDGRLLREAERSTREASDAVVDAAERVLSGAGQAATDDVRSRLAATLRAAIVNPDVGSRLQAGMLERDVELAGFGMELSSASAPASAPSPPRPRPRPPRPHPSEEDTAEQRERRERQEREEQEERARQEDRRRREEARREARRRLAELESEAKRVGRHAQRLALEADRAEEEARRARAEADSAVAAAEEATARVAEVRRKLEDLGAE